MTISREAFEEWMISVHGKEIDLSRGYLNNEHYIDAFAHEVWVAWQAALSTVEKEPDSKLVEENARLREALDACLLMCDFSSIPAIETKTKEALKAKGE